ncbi:uncharacterized protein CG7065 [Anabrus simplex]|uniref:uncharacterized protein CG7065 n=1 Tax=Anabrus simplex TaxID=316456 RepID=UPI0035A385DE
MEAKPDEAAPVVADPLIAMEQQLMDIKVKIDPDTNGFVFSRKKVDEEFVWHCHLCNARIQCMIFVQDHIDSKRHQQKMQVPQHPRSLFKRIEHVKKTADVPQGTIESVAKIQDTLNNFKGAALIGLEYLVEILPHFGDEEPRYFCALCDKKGDPRIVLGHLTSFKHHFKYLHQHFPIAYRDLQNKYGDKACKDELHDAVSRLCKQIEESFGRLKPTVCSVDYLETHKTEIKTRINHGVHFREPPGGFLLQSVSSNKDLQRYPSEQQGVYHPGFEDPSRRVVTHHGAQIQVQPVAYPAPVGSSFHSHTTPNNMRMSESVAYPHPAGRNIAGAAPVGPVSGTAYDGTRLLHRQMPPEAYTVHPSKRSTAMHSHGASTPSFPGSGQQRTPVDNRGGIAGQQSDSRKDSKENRYVDVITKKLRELKENSGIKSEATAKRVKSDKRKSVSPVSGSSLYRNRSRVKSRSRSKSPHRVKSQFRTRSRSKSRSRGGDEQYRNRLSRNRFRRSRSRSRPRRSRSRSRPRRSRSRSPRQRSRSRSRPRRSRSRSPRRYRRRSRSRSRSPFIDRQNEDAENRKWDKKQSIVKDSSKESSQWTRFFEEFNKVVEEMHKKSKYYEENPEKHPKYNSEWEMFWKNKCNELIAKNKDPNRYDFKPEWAKFWEKRAKHLYEEELIVRRSELKIKYGLTGIEEKPKHKILSHDSSSAKLEEEVTVLYSSKDNSDNVGLYDKPHKEKSDRPRKEVNVHVDNVKDYVAAVLTEKKEAAKKNVTINEVLQVLTAMESQLGSLGPRINALLAQALILEKSAPGSSQSILDNPENVVLLEMVREKLKGQVVAGIVQDTMVAATQKCINSLTNLLESVVKKAFVPPPMQLTEHNNTSASEATSLSDDLVVNKVEIAQQIAAALIAQGKTDVSQEELKELINAVVGMTQPSVPQEPKTKKNSQLLSQVNKMLGTSKAERENSQLQGRSQAASEVSSRSAGEEIIEDSSITENLHQLSDDDLNTLVQNFKDLSPEEQQCLIAYLKRIENRAGSVQNLIDSVEANEIDAKSDASDEDSSFRAMYAAVSQKVKEREMAMEAEGKSQWQNILTQRADVSRSVFGQAQGLVANFVDSLPNLPVQQNYMPPFTQQTFNYETVSQEDLRALQVSNPPSQMAPLQSDQFMHAPGQIPVNIQRQEVSNKPSQQPKQKLQKQQLQQIKNHRTNLKLLN